MNWALTLYAFSILAVIIVSVSTFEYSRRRRDVAGGTAFMWASALVCGLALMEGLSLLAPSGDWARFWFDLRFISIALLPPVWLIFVIQFAGGAKRITAFHVAALLLIPVLTQAVIWTNPLHGLWVVKPVVFRQEGLFFIARPAERFPGLWMWIYLAYSYTLTVAGLAILGLAALRLDRRDRGQLYTVMLGTLIMAVTSSIPLFGALRYLALNPLVPGIAVGMLIIFYSAYRRQFLKPPLAFREKSPPWPLVVLFILLAAGIISAGYYYTRHYEADHRLEVEQMLAVVADLKVSEIVHWRKERLSEAAVLRDNDSFSQLTRQVIDAPGDAQAAARMQNWLTAIYSAYEYQSVILMNASGGLKQSAGSGQVHVCGEIRKRIPELKQSRKIIFLDLHRDTRGRAIHLSVLVPITQKDRFLGAVALVIDPTRYLYPMIARWPAPSKTAETLLVRREGREVVFLNELKFQKNTALNLRFPLSRENLPAARAARGEERMMDGVDYRGQPVVAALRPVPDSPWFLVARMDASEIYPPIREHNFLMILMMSGLIFGAAAGVWLFWQRQRSAFYHRELDAASALQASEEKFRKAFMTSPDAIAITRWSDGRIISVNPGFRQITGFAREEVEGKIMADLPIWENQDDRIQLLQAIKADGTAMNGEIRFRRKNGDARDGLLSTSLIDLNGESHILTITRDITERKQSEDALRKAHERLRRFYDSNVVGIVIATADGRIIEANDYYLSMIGYSREEFRTGKINWRAITPPEWLAADDKAIADVLREDTSSPYEKQYLLRDGTRIDILIAVASLPGDEQQLAAFILDITDRKRAEREVLRLNEELEKRVAQRTAELQVKNEELERLNRVFVDRELRMRELKRQIAEREKK
ncbi:MAG: PAS domain S-box protein [Deltaproteobacteria bacterium]|nr:PAS domain S-box protein [Deltaproteobacteria bacterium]